MLLTISFWLVPAYLIFWLFWFWISVTFNERAQSKAHHYSTRHLWDDLIPFVPGFAIFYFSAYVLANMAFMLVYPDLYFVRVFGGYLLLALIGGGAYLLFPCQVDRRENLKVHNISTRLLAAFQKKSKPFNSFPSMHVGYCTFSALVVLGYSSVGLGIVLLIWAGLVALSTLLTKQHHLLDVFAGVVLASVIFWTIQL